MEISPLMIYVIGIADNFRSVLFWSAMLSCVLSLFFGILSIAEEESKLIFRKYVMPSLIISCLLLSLIPSSKTLASMYVIPAVVNNEQIQNIGKNGLESLELLTRQWVKELREDGEKESK